MTLNRRKFTSDFTRCLLVGIKRLLLCWKNSKVIVPVGNHNHRSPTTLMWCYSHKTVLVVFSCFKVAHILNVFSLSQVLPAVVRWVSINVVDGFCWPRSGHVQPCQSVGVTMFVPYANNAIPIYVFSARQLPYEGLGLFRRTAYPSKETSARIIMQYRAQKVSGNVVVGIACLCFAGLSHSTLLRSWLEAGKRFQDAYLPRFHNTGGVLCQ